MILKENLEDYKYKILSFLILSILIGLILGTAIANFFILTSIIFFLINSKDYYKFTYKELQTIDKILLVFFLYLIFSSLFSDYAFHALQKSILYFKFFLVFIVIKTLIIQNNYFFSLVWKLFLPIFLILIVDGLFQFMVGYNFVGIEKTSNRISSFFGDEWILGSYLYHTIPFIFASLYFQNCKNNKKIFYYISISFLTILIIYISGERTAFFLSLIYFLVINLMMFAKKLKYSLISVILLILIILIYPSKRILNSFEFTMHGDTKVYSTFGVYQDLYSTAYKIHKDKKIIGHGLQSFRKLCQDQKYKTGKFGCSTHPHNYYFQILAENGIIGLIIFLSLIIFLLKDLIQLFLKWKNKFDENYLILLIILTNILISFIPFVPTGNLYSSVTGIFLFFKFALYFALKKRMKI